MTRHSSLFATTRALHDAATYWVEPNIFGQASPLPFASGNFRLSEIGGALGLAQLEASKSWIARLREVSTLLIGPLRSNRSVRLRPEADADGSNGTSVVFYVGSRDEALDRAQVLRERGVAATPCSR